MKQRIVYIDKSQSGTPFSHTHNVCVGAGRANEGLRADWQNQLKECVKECGFSYLRFHGLLSDDMGVYQINKGKEWYNFQYIDSLFDAMLRIGIRPFVEFGFMPKALSSKPEEILFWWNANSAPPKDYDAWARLLKACVEHWIERYGIDEVLNWYFEIWNEPNLNSFWRGTKTEYFRLYEVSVKAIKEVDTRLRVGGPATSNFVPDGRFEGEVMDLSKLTPDTVQDIDALHWRATWIKELLEFAAEKGLPVDFISTHPYPTDFGFADERGDLSGRSRKKESIKEDIVALQKIIKNSAYPNAQLYLTEWSSSPISDDYAHDYLPEADYIVKSNIDCDGLMDSLSYWVFTDIFEEAGPGREAFHGGFGLMNIQGIKKPAYHAYRFLNELGNEELFRPEEGIVTKATDGTIRALFYNYADEVNSSTPMSVYPDRTPAEETQAMGETIQLHLEMTGLKPNARVMAEILDEDNGTCTTLWKEMGYPANLTPDQTNALLKFAEATKVIYATADENGNLVWDIEQKPWAVVLVKECR